MRQTRYYSNYGFCTFHEPFDRKGNGILNDIGEVIKTVASNNIVKNAVSSVSHAAVKSIGQKIGNALGNKIADSFISGKPQNLAKNVNVDEAKIREKVLDDLKLLPDDYTRLIQQHGDGAKRRQKVRGAGLKILT
jgi:hypothetical protein